MKRRIVVMLASALFASTVARASEIPIGLVSFDVFIPASGTPGVNAFDIFDFTGPIFGPAVGPPYAADSLTFQNATLIVFFQDGSSQAINLGNIGPGELLDSNGNPVVQFPSTDNFTSAVATLSPTSFMLSDGSAFRASASISADLLPSSGSLLVAGTDFAIVNAEPVAVIPEPANWVLLSTGWLLLAFFVTALKGQHMSSRGHRPR